MKRLTLALALLLLSYSAFADTVLVTGSNRGIGLQLVTQ